MVHVVVDVVVDVVDLVDLQRYDRVQGGREVLVLFFFPLGERGIVKVNL